MPLGAKPFSINRHTHTKAGTVTAITTALDDLVTGDASFGVIHDTAVTLAASMVDLAADPLPGQEISMTIYGTLDSWEAGRPDAITGAQVHVQVNVAAEI